MTFSDIRYLILVIFIATCISGCPGDSSSDPQPPATFRESFPANIAPIIAPPFFCGAPGVATQNVMQKLNAFWQSNVRACACDLISTPQCTHNAFALPAPAVGFIYYDAVFLSSVDITSGSTLPADFFMAHEFGHNIQVVLGLNPPGQLRELQADCLGGYYVGFQVHKGQVQLSELLSTFQFACNIGDPLPTNFWDPTHGTCPQRVAAVQQGVNGYNQLLLPGQACP